MVFVHAGVIGDAQHLKCFSVEGCVLKYYAEAIYREKMNDNHGVRRKRGCILEKRRVQDVMQRHDMTCFPMLNAVPICEVPGASADSSFTSALK
jgi:hypothetical protein